MNIEHVDGENRGKILLYALSTCGWCRKTKEFLKKLGVEFSYIYVDLVDEIEKDKVIQEVRKCNPRNSYPTIIINDNQCIVGYKEDEIREVLNK
ncbi:MAG: NrdH-redoxin [Thermoplasmatales archaeon SG8-52-3]|nr:MAG: NrdH-redoxin [Thermoplasmatales archaeon SG8-52-3]